MGLVLWLLSIILSIILLPIGLVFGIIKAIYKNMLFKEGIPIINRKFIRLATAVDLFGNVACAELFNATLIKKDSKHLFGNYGETISECIGYNLLNDSLTKTGKKINGVLNFFDKDHALKAIKYK